MFPSAATLRITQDRFEEKTFVNELGLKTAPFRKADRVLDGSGILKTRRMGYDGKGQARVNGARELAQARERFKYAPLHPGRPDRLRIRGLGRRGARRRRNPLPPTIRRRTSTATILRRSIVPSRLSDARAEEAKAMAKTIADALGYVGVLAVELFVTRDALLVNEIAPRVHNSGHWTIEACVTSQFEQHIRAVAGWPLGSASRHSDAVMDNLSATRPPIGARSRPGAARCISYGKSEIRAGTQDGACDACQAPNRFGMN